MKSEIKTKIAEIVSALGAVPAVGINGIIPGDFVAEGIQYSFQVIKLTCVYPFSKENGYYISIYKDAEKELEVGFYTPTSEIIEQLKLL